jgi:HEAT repeat protein
VSNDLGIVIPSIPIPPGTPFSEREAVVYRGLLRANGYDAVPAEYRRATGSSEPTLRAAAFALLARDPAAHDLARFAQGAEDPDLAVRAFAAFGLERLDPGRGAPVLREVAARDAGFGDYGPLIAAALLARLGDASGFATVERAMSVATARIPAIERLWPFARLRTPGIWAAYDQALASGDAVVREQVLAQLRELGSPEAVPVLERLLARLPDDDAWKPTVHELIGSLAGAR